MFNGAIYRNRADTYAYRIDFCLNPSLWCYCVAMKGSRERILVPEGHSFRIIRWDRTLRNVELILEPEHSCSIPGRGAHWHYHSAMELTLFTRGGGTRFVGDHIGRIEENDLVLLGERLPHYWHEDGPSSGMAIQWEFPETHAIWAIPEAICLEPLFREASRGIQFTGRTAETTARSINRLCRSQGLKQFSEFLEILVTLSEAPALRRRTLSIAEFLPSKKETHQHAIDLAVRFIMANFRSKILLADVLPLVAMSKATFARLFKGHTGKTFVEFVNTVRLESALREIVSSERSILDIALSNGYPDISGFNRWFLRTIGCTPTEYRNSPGDHDLGDPGTREKRYG